MLLAAEFWAGACGRGLTDGFRRLNWSVQEIDPRDFGIQPGGDLRLRIVKRVTRRMADELYRQKLLAECRALKPDVFFTVKGVGITRDLLIQIKETGARAVMYYPDVAFDHLGVSIDSFREYDLFVTTKTFQTAYLEGLLGTSRVAYVPHGYVPSVHRPMFDRMDEQGYSADVLHAGNHSVYKQKWIEDAASALPQSKFRIVGNRWQQNAGDGALATCEMLGERLGVSYAEAIQTARINVAIHFGPTATGWEDKVSTRTFEIPACQGFMLHIDSEELREFFRPGVEVDVFSTLEELVDKIRFYIARPELRAQMIGRSFARCVPAYSYHARAGAIDSLLKQRS